MERRNCNTPNALFHSPFIVYKIISEVAYKVTLEICGYLLSHHHVDKIYVEDLNTINIDKIMQANITDSVFFQNNYQKYSQMIFKFDLLTENSDLCIVVGGDGTTLWANHLYNDKKRPSFLTFNLGTLGYMAIYNHEDYKGVLDELYNEENGMSFEKRTLINCKTYEKIKNEDGSFICCNFLWETTALNDFVIEKCTDCKMVRLQIFMNDEPLTEVRCDGLVLATSTGSTAYSLSAGGSIVHYDVDALILNAICPHSLSFRQIILPRGITITVAPSPESESKIGITNDGIKTISIERNQYVEVRVSDLHADFIVLSKYAKNRVNLWKQKLLQQLGWNK